MRFVSIPSTSWCRFTEWVACCAFRLILALLTLLVVLKIGPTRFCDMSFSRNLSMLLTYGHVRC